MTKKNKPEKNHGGKRTGSGRPPTGHVHFQIKLRPETAALLREKLPEGLRSAYVDAAILKALKNDAGLLEALKNSINQ